MDGGGGGGVGVALWLDLMLKGELQLYSIYRRLHLSEHVMPEHDLIGN